MPRKALNPVLGLLLLAACDSDPGRPSAEETCAPDFILDGEACVPVTCGVGTWGELEVDGTTVHVDAASGDDGDGSAEKPLRSIQAGLDLAVERGSRLVAVAAGIYAETLDLGPEHSDTHLAGRCHQLVTLDASVGAPGTPGIDIDPRQGEVSVTGLTVDSSTYIGVLVVSGQVHLEDIRVVRSNDLGVVVARDRMATAMHVEMSHSEVSENLLAGILACTSETHLSLIDVTVTDTVDGGPTIGGFGVDVYGGATLEAEDCVITGHPSAGVLVMEEETTAYLENVTIEQIRPTSGQPEGFGIRAEAGAFIEARGCTITDNTTAAIIAHNAGTSVHLLDTVIEGTQPDATGEQGHGMNIQDGAAVLAEGCELIGNSSTGINMVGHGTRVELRYCTVRDTLPDTFGSNGLGAYVREGAVLLAQETTFASNARVGLIVGDPGSTAQLRDVVVRSTRPDDNGLNGCGIQVHDGGWLSAERVMLVANAGDGLSVTDAGSMATLSHVTIRDSVPNAEGSLGRGIEVDAGALLEADGCLIAGNPEFGLGLTGEGTVARLRNTALLGPDAYTAGPAYGVYIDQGARLEAESCEIVGCNYGVYAHDPATAVVLEDVTLLGAAQTSSEPEGMGVGAFSGSSLKMRSSEIAQFRSTGLQLGNPGTQAHLVDVRIVDTMHWPDGRFGYGVTAWGGSSLTANRVWLDSNIGAGLVAAEHGTQVQLRDVTITGTQTNPTLQGMTAPGLVSQQGATVEATVLSASNNEGPGLYTSDDGSLLSCADCLLEGNHFAGAVVIEEAALEIASSTITSNPESSNLGGGVGVFASAQWTNQGPTLTLTDSVVSDQAVAGVWLGEDGNYHLEGNTISQSTGVPHGATRRCGDGVFARSVTGDGEHSGLALVDNTLSGHAGAGLFLQDADATIEGNSWSDNGTDLWAQGSPCPSVPEPYPGVPDQELCPAWDQPTCPLFFTLAMIVDDPDPRLVRTTRPAFHQTTGSAPMSQVTLMDGRRWP